MSPNPNVGDLRPDVKDAMAKLRKDFEQRTGHKTVVPYDGGARTHETQQRIYADSLKHGFRAATPGNSPHEYGAAFDLNIVGATVGDAAKDKANPLYKTLADLGRAYGLKAGYYFTSGKPDPYHFEANESLATMREKWNALQQDRGVIPKSGASPVVVVGGLAIAALLYLVFRR